MEAGAQAPTPATRSTARRRSFPVWRWAILLIAAVYFLIPLYSGLRFAGLKAFPDVFKQAGFISAIGLSLRLAVLTTILTLVLMVPTVVYIHLRLPRIRRLMEAITILPIVIPPIVLIVGVLNGRRHPARGRGRRGRWDRRDERSAAGPEAVVRDGPGA